MAFDNAWIGYENLFEQYQNSITSTASDTGADPLSLGNWWLWDRWQGVAGTNKVAAILDCGSVKAVDYFAVAGHNVVSTNTVLRLIGSNDADFAASTTILTFNPSGVAELYNGASLYNGVAYHDGEVLYINEAPSADYVLGFSFTQVAFRYFKVEYTSAFKLILSVLSMGLKMTFEQGFYGGFQPPRWNDVVEATNNKSENGVFLGRSIVRAGTRPFKITAEPVTHAWVDSVWSPFRQHAEVKPFIFAWGTSPYMDRVYAWEKGFDPSKVKNRVHASVGVSCEGVRK